VEALDAGADDYVTKPFSIKVLTARLRAAIRRAQLPETKLEGAIAIGAIELHAERRQVILLRDGKGDLSLCQTQRAMFSLVGFSNPSTSFK